MAYFKREKVRGTTPLDIKAIDDNFANLFLKLFGNIDGGDILEGSITGKNIAANTITADKIAVGALEVGVNVIMGESAYISWDHVTNQPSFEGYTDEEAVAAWKASGYATYIDANGAYFGDLHFVNGQTIDFNPGNDCSLQITENDISSTSKSGRLWLNWYGNISPDIPACVCIGDGSGHGTGTVEDPYLINGYGDLRAGNIYSNDVLVATCADGAVTLGTAVQYPLDWVRTWVQDDEPTAARTKDVWVDTNDYSRYDFKAVTGATTLAVEDNEYVTVSGTFNLTLHAATNIGIIKRLFNIGTGIVTVVGTINGLTNMLLYPGESVDLVTDGSGWRC